MAVYKNMADYEKKLKKWEKDFPNDMVKALGQAAEEVRKEVLTKHLNGLKMPSGVGSESHATLGIKTGKLRSSISEKVFRTAGGIKAWVGTFISPTDYAKKHEFGIGVPKRPFLSPSLKAKRKWIVNHLQKKMMESYKNA